LLVSVLFSVCLYWHPSCCLSLLLFSLLFFYACIIIYSRSSISRPLPGYFIIFSRLLFFEIQSRVISLRIVDRYYFPCRFY
jgi:hypothetical protein